MKFISFKSILANIQRIRSVEGREGLELMDRNERTVDFPPEYLEGIRGLVTPFLLRAYPEPEPLYVRLADWLNCPREMLLLTSGADGGLRSVFEAFVEPQEEVVYAAPSYAMYSVYCGLSGAAGREVRFGKDLSLDVDRVIEQINPKTKLVVLANPNQPIERIYTEAEIRELLEACERNNALMVMDEAYYHFCPLTALPFLKTHGNLIIVRTFSKAFGIAGLRLGYLVSQPRNIEVLNKVRPMYETNAMAIAAGLFLLDHEEVMQAYVAEVKKALAFMSQEFSAMGFSTTGRWGNSLLVGLPPDLPAGQVAALLKERGFLIRAESQAPLTNHLRITAGSKSQADRFLRAFHSVLPKQKIEESSR